MLHNAKKVNEVTPKDWFQQWSDHEVGFLGEVECTSSYGTLSHFQSDNIVEVIVSVKTSDCSVHEILP